MGENIHSNHFLLVIRGLLGPSHSSGTSLPDLKWSLSVPSHPNPIVGLGISGLASIPCVRFLRNQWCLKVFYVWLEYGSCLVFLLNESTQWRRPT